MMFGIPASEWVGYAASVFVGTSLLMSDMSRLRIINLIGCILFAIYGLWIGAYPVAIMNIFGAGVNIWHLLRLARERRVNAQAR